MSRIIPHSGFCFFVCAMKIVVSPLKEEEEDSEERVSTTTAAAVAAAATVVFCLHGARARATSFDTLSFVKR